MKGDRVRRAWAVIICATFAYFVTASDGCERYMRLGGLCLPTIRSGSTAAPEASADQPALLPFIYGRRTS